MAFWAGVASSLTLYGDSVCLILDVDRLGYPTALKPIHPLHAAVRFGRGDQMEPDIVGWYVGGRFYDYSEVWHVKSHIHRTGQPLGIGLLEGVIEGISASQAQQDYRASFFANGGMPSGVIKVHRPEVGTEEAARLKAEWVQKFSGTSEPAVLNELTDFTPVAYKPVDSQMVESAELSVKDTALMWGLPVTKLGAQAGTGTYRNAESEERQTRGAIAPWARLLEQAVSIDLLPRGQKAKWNLDAYLRADTETRFRAYSQALNNQPWLLPDEVRALEGIDPMAHAEEDLPTDAAASGGHVPPVDSGVGGPAAANRSTNGAKAHV
jgi:HK97 family phage portal protein